MLTDFWNAPLRWLKLQKGAIKQFRVPLRARLFPAFALDLPLSRRQAARVLNVGLMSSKKMIETNYKMLIKRNHPDVSKSAYLATVLGDARERLNSST